MRVVQCWDDGTVEDIRYIEILKRHGAKATFNLNPGLCKKGERAKCGAQRDGKSICKLSLDELKDVYKGFDIGGHSMTHAKLHEIAPEAALKDLVDNKLFIKETFGIERCGFAYPCGVCNDALKELVKKAGYVYARTTENVALKLNVDDPLALKSHCHFSYLDFWDKFEAVRKIDGDFYFWGHTFELSDDEKRWAELERTIERISSTPGVKWAFVKELFN